MEALLRILFLSKRHPQNRDLIERPYGRFYYLPRLLGEAGHEVRVLLCSHKRLPSVDLHRDSVRWTSHDLRTLGPLALASRLQKDADAFAPDWIVGCSDIWYGLLAKRIAMQSGVRFAIDAYDNFESYMPWNLPLHTLWHRAIARADKIIAAGPQLAARLDSHRLGKPPATVVPMAADPAFTLLDHSVSRSELGLPDGSPLIGYMGGWARNRGTQTLIEAFRQVRTMRPDARLVLTGRPPEQVLAEPGVIGLGYVEDSKLPVALSALDIASVITADTSFGRYSYPAKLCEAMACNVPVAATATEPVRWMLGDDRRFLARIGDEMALAMRILDLLDGPRRIRYPSITSWRDSARSFEAALMS